MDKKRNYFKTHQKEIIMKKIFMLLLAASVAPAAFAQKKPLNMKPSLNYGDVSFAIGSSEGAFSLSYWRNWKVTKNGKLQLGLGARLSNYFGSNQYYRTAPAKLTSGKSSFGALFAEDIPGNIDSFKVVGGHNMSSVNIAFNARYIITPRFYAGFNIDLTGFTLGGKKEGNYINGSITQTVKAKPTGFNILLISDSDRGSLNSELYAAYRLTPRIAIKGAFQFIFTEYTTDTKVQVVNGIENDRFRRKSGMASLGVQIDLK
jgi:hypothetical protein